MSAGAGLVDPDAKCGETPDSGSRKRSASQWLAGIGSAERTSARQPPGSVARLAVARWRNASASGGWWTRTQRIRTAGMMPLEAALLEVVRPPTYQQIAREAWHLYSLGLSCSRIARALAVTDKTVAKAIRWRAQH